MKIKKKLSLSNRTNKELFNSVNQINCLETFKSSNSLQYLNKISMKEYLDDDNNSIESDCSDSSNSYSDRAECTLSLTIRL